MDTIVEVKIKRSLQDLREAISRAEGGKIAASLAKLDHLASEHGRELDPQLRHFLQRRSYEKAWAFLGGESDIPEGSCGGGR